MAELIEVICDRTGDSAQTDSEMGALIAARALMEDAQRAALRQGYADGLTCTFLDARGGVIRTRVTRQTVWSAIGRYQTAQLKEG